MAITNRPLSFLAADMKNAYPVSGEINQLLTNPEKSYRFSKRLLLQNSHEN
ncbi:protein of unknown function [Maridesulfovibrio hydrothermalis AM13 = DSM 14728]|uniref:Uncharacterized protein n=1 Tax=Maridesulfovibrio hydrothermalis AM13 = DSM 14728 TaxID=1121451 RepID=L0R944_9BACT|nr:protein of unknown function [Maridesulfovibrio hydrothermalis AM13 = DSM 14728]